ncbi:hypothetical protein EDD86DRAFT_247998 [Gorgonomyces haynaldii]|nr:hypothetical protein EDD86DRAFT_247998 [Gorgonomyces haynaldii]
MPNRRHATEDPVDAAEPVDVPEASEQCDEPQLEPVENSYSQEVESAPESEQVAPEIEAEAESGDESPTAIATPVFEGTPLAQISSYGAYSLLPTLVPDATSAALAGYQTSSETLAPILANSTPQQGIASSLLLGFLILFGLNFFR